MNRRPKPRAMQHAPWKRRHALCGKVAFSHSIARTPDELSCEDCYAILYALSVVLTGRHWDRPERFQWDITRPPVWL